MSCTIDNLRVEHHVTVLRDFTDVSGTVVTAGTQGVLRGLGLDTLTREIWIVFEQCDQLTTWRFHLLAKQGPRNGHMRDFFELGEPVPDPTPRIEMEADDRSVRAPSNASPPSAASSSPRLQPPNDTCLNERTVACDCPIEFHRALLPAALLPTHACLRCGTVTCTRSVGDDGRFSGEVFQAYFTITLDPAVIAWLAQWPRVQINYAADSAFWPMAAEWVGYPTLYYPAQTRTADRAQLQTLEGQLRQTQSGRGTAEILRELCRGIPDPPQCLPQEMLGFADLWEALQLQPNGGLSHLIRLAQRRNPASPIAVELLLRRPDAFEIMIDALRQRDSTWFSAGFAMAREARPTHPELSRILLEILQALPLDPLPDVPDRVISWARFESIFILIAELKFASPEMQEALRALMRRLARHDATLVGYIRIVLQSMGAHPKPPGGETSPVPWL